MQNVWAHSRIMVKILYYLFTFFFLRFLSRKKKHVGEDYIFIWFCDIFLPRVGVIVQLYVFFFHMAPFLFLQRYLGMYMYCISNLSAPYFFKHTGILLWKLFFFKKWVKIIQIVSFYHEMFFLKEIIKNIHPHLNLPIVKNWSKERKIQN